MTECFTKHEASADRPRRGHRTATRQRLIRCAAEAFNTQGYRLHRLSDEPGTVLVAHASTRSGEVRLGVVRSRSFEPYAA
jgi:hypothetical protein